MVSWVGDAWAAIDGHHRLAAYRFAGWKGAIPVTPYRGTLDEAMGYAGKLNSGEKLPMTNAEKKATAWKLTTCTQLSKERVRLASGMSDGFLGAMRAARKKLIEKMGLSAEEVAGMSWNDARMRAAGESPEVQEIDREAWLDEQAQEMANQLLKALGKQGQQKHEVLARALWIYDSRLPDSLREHWDDDRGLVEPLEETNPDF
jgi:ParB-like chromosome segregation protein Spo0J